MVFVIIGKPDSVDYKNAVATAKEYSKTCSQKEVIFKVDVKDRAEEIILEELEVNKQETKTVTFIFWLSKTVGKVSGKITIDKLDDLFNKFNGTCDKSG